MSTGLSSLQMSAAHSDMIDKSVAIEKLLASIIGIILSVQELFMCTSFRATSDVRPSYVSLNHTRDPHTPFITLFRSMS